LILNSQRQDIYANKILFESLNIDENEVFGFRPGELLECEHAFENKGGCGTTEFCSQCGAVNVILNSQKGINDVRECRITRRNGDALDLRVWGSWFDMEGERYTIFTLADISHEKRRRALERIFFHDILNTTCSLQFTSYLLKGADPAEKEDLIENVGRITEALNEEIVAQRTLTNAENDELFVQVSLFNSAELLREMALIATHNELAKSRSILCDPTSVNVDLSTDRVLLKRVIGNLIKNALEATRTGDSITLGANFCGGEIQFWVNNPGFISREVQLQIFHRSFSTKGTGRGLGTYSIKLLTERYLKGSVSFTTSPEEGTTFKITIPMNLE
jgi:signal transduction histidine kinase